MSHISLENLVKENVQKNIKSSFYYVKKLTKQEINKYKNFTYDTNFVYENRRLNFSNYSKIIDKLSDTNLYFEIATKEGFYLLEYNGLHFRSIELNDDSVSKSLKKYEPIEDLNKELQTWLNVRYNKRRDIMTKSDLLEIKMFQSIINHKSHGKSNKPKVEEINEK